MIYHYPSIESTYGEMLSRGIKNKYQWLQQDDTEIVDRCWEFFFSFSSYLVFGINPYGSTSENIFVV